MKYIFLYLAMPLTISGSYSHQTYPTQEITYTRENRHIKGLTIPDTIYYMELFQPSMIQLLSFAFFKTESLIVTRDNTVITRKEHVHHVKLWLDNVAK